jgi:hypothetical protein
MKHFILTRFNEGLYDIKMPMTSKEWMERRLELFQNHTLPSVKSQRNQNFQWLIRIDKNTPQSYKNKLAEIIPKNANLIECEFMQIVRSYISDWYITTRLDNDDEITPSFVETIQKYAEEGRMLIDFDGIQWDIINNKKYTDGRIYNNSPFISVVEHKDYLKGVYYAEHSFMPRHFEKQIRVRNIGYIQILHDHNLANKPKGQLIE